MGFDLAVNYRPRGDQENAIAELTRGIREGEQHQVLLGVTGSGKTFTMAKVIEAIGRPALVLAHNKTLAAQLYHEFKSFFPGQRGGILRQLLRLLSARSVHSRRATSISRRKPRSTTSSTSCGSPPPSRLFERRDCVIVASVSCIYGLGSPEAYYGMLLMLEKGQKISRNEISQAGRDPVRPQRRRFPPRHLPRARRRDRGLPHLRRLRLPHRALGRRSGEPLADRPAARQVNRPIPGCRSIPRLTT